LFSARVSVSVFVLAIVAVSCDPGGPPSARDVADITTVLKPGGIAETEVSISERDPAESLAIAEDVGRALFPDKPSTARMGKTGGGFPLPIVATEAFEPGPKVPFQMTTAALESALDQYGFRDVSYDICLPDVPTEEEHVGVLGPDFCESVDVLEEPPLAVQGVFVPDPGRYHLGIALAALALTASVIGAALALNRKSRRKTTIGVGLLILAGAAAIAAWFLPWPSAYDNAVVGWDRIAGGQIPWAVATGLLFFGTLCVVGTSTAAVVAYVDERRGAQQHPDV
jgi:hypothetical protein